MGFSEKPQVGSACVESEGNKKWVIAGISIRASLKPVSTEPKPRTNRDDADEEERETPSTTPTSKESRIAEKLQCPPAPRKRRPSSSRCHFNGVREFFNPPDLESVFKRHVERTN
ncbi:cyclin-dependent protein kinase inhibitor SMR6 [Eucalyptus grandis]|uniref:Uncharacterized protein n=3 Tax=Eucalyptus TaxID=3932 RepID=A0ACC3JGB4_EUCGR|nr:cyclin-dependent protein kinase inhibitor SMR6 [Eucalyptus grandis]KAK3413148.1 hypothetical protein EUGRSUZ_I01742 [Eucalyptus grandis]